MTTRCNKYNTFFILNATFILSIQKMSQAADTIATAQTIKDNGDTVISANGIFELGYYSPENSKNRYVGIWYKKITVKKTVVWVANRNSPLLDTSGVLRVIEPGLLVLLNSTNGTIVWSTNTSRSVQTPFARLLDSGNLVVKDVDDENPENFLWQSFNYPADTFLPGMKLGINYVTGLEVYITSSKNNGDPATGEFTYHCDPTGYPQNVIKKGAAVQFRTGPWNGLGFSGNPNLQQNTIFTFGVTMKREEVYYHFEQLNESVPTRFTLSESGIGQRWVWVDRTQGWIIYLTIPIDNCDIYNSCGPYGSCNNGKSPVCGCLDKFKPRDPQGWAVGDWSNGCTRNTPFNCQKGSAFKKYSAIKLPDTRHSWFNSTMTLEECRSVCSINCSCTAYPSLDISRGGDGDGCLLWFGDLLDVRNISPGQDIYIRLASSDLEVETRGQKSTDSQRKKREILVLTVSLVVGMLLLCLSLWLCFQRYKKQDHYLRETGRLRLDHMDNHPDESHKELDLPQFYLSEITRATDNFSIQNKLGEGGFGPVYKGVLEEGQEIAVKRLSKTSSQGVDEFKNEVMCIAKLQHRNLVKLLGWCTQGAERMLVYEYMTNKSLDLILFDPVKSILLDWPRRFSIVNGIARGLMYLHQDSPLRVIHRDLKASNVLDSDMNPKISDFGLARTFGGNETEANTSRVVGTYGYMSPEYAVDGLFSVKSDVFSFGVLLLEIISGKRNRGFTHTDHRLNLLGHAWMLYKEERSLELLDSCVRNSCCLRQVLQSIQVGLLCVQEHPEDRPNMSSVVLMLSNGSGLPEAKHPRFFTGRDLLRTETSVSSDKASSNAMTITLLEAR